MGFTFLAICSILAISLDYFKYERAHYRDLLIWDNPIVVNWDKQVVAKQYLMKYGGITKTQSIRSKPVSKWEVVLTYENKDQFKRFSKEFLLEV